MMTRVVSLITLQRAWYSTSPGVAIKPWQDIPGLSSLPIFGALHHFLPIIGHMTIRDPYDMMALLRKDYGDIVKLGLPFSSEYRILLFDPKDIEQVLRGEEPLPVRGGFQTLEYFRKHVRNDFFGGVNGLIADHGDSWKSFRSKVNPILMKPNVIKVHRSSLDQVAKDMIERIKRIKDDGSQIRDNLALEMNKFSLESVALVGLGGRLGCLNDNLDENSPARKLIQNVIDIFTMQWKLEVLPSLWKYYSTRNFKKAMKIYEDQLRLSEDFINEAMKDIKSKGSAQQGEKSVLESLLEIDKKIAVVMASDMLFAGVDTVAHTLIGIMYMLAMNPDKQEKLRGEIKKGENVSYLKACIKEGIRFTPIIPGNLRKTTKDHVVGGYQIPKGMEVIFPHEYLSLQEEHFPRAKEYLPERWLVDRSDPLHYSHAHQLVYLPFGFGVRSCVGRRIAEMEMECLLTHLINNFHIEWLGEPLKRVSQSLTLTRPPYNFKFRDVDGNIS